MDRLITTAIESARLSGLLEYGQKREPVRRPKPSPGTRKRVTAGQTAPDDDLEIPKHVLDDQA